MSTAPNAQGRSEGLQGMTVMSRFDDLFAERLVNFVLPLIVATLIAATGGYVLSGALFGSSSHGPTHRTAAATWRPHS